MPQGSPRPPAPGDGPTVQIDPRPPSRELPTDVGRDFVPSDHHKGNLGNHAMSRQSNYDTKMIIRLEDQYRDRGVGEPGTSGSVMTLSSMVRPTVRVRPRSLQELTFRKHRPL